MADELSKIHDMLLEGTAELQCAAAMVLGGLKARDAKTRKALVKALQSGNDLVRTYALDALTKVAPEEALPHVVPLLGETGNLRTRAVQMLLQGGGGVASLLRSQMKTADPLVRKGIVDVLARLQGKESPEALLKNLLDTDAEVARQASISFGRLIGTMATDQKKKLATKALSLLKGKKKNTSLSPVLQVLGLLQVPTTARTLATYLDKKKSNEIRLAAMKALGLFREGLDATELLPKLWPLFEESSSSELVESALSLLYRAKFTARHATQLKKLMKHSHTSVQLFALRALGTLATKDAGDLLLQSLWSNDREISDAAADALRSSPKFVPALLKALEESQEKVKGWKLADLLKSHAGELDATKRKSLQARMFRQMDKGEVRYRQLFEILATASARDLRRAVLRRGRDQVAKKDFEAAEKTFSLLEREDLSSSETLYWLAITRLRLRRKDEASVLFSRLLGEKDFSLIKQLEKDLKFIQPRALLTLGFHFVEHPGVVRSFGADLLKLVSKKFAKKDEGRIAKNKLKTQGLK